ncbi:Uncharacterized conserved protein, DUF305 family [Streptomyces sp. AmelKG-A3]|nr:DUF305 domain-containing protein [Streptomyces sp. SID4941]SCE12144.1 Uncharacterized conserved protein, DUF305 family [Streptomyces sp. PalvLS-984]SDC26461.1 Uncharacterized conserved protein, DUF305 family [Streptomyces sp. AmelKG-A3]
MLIPRHMARGRAAALGTLVVAALALGGCDADGGDEAASKASGPAVVAPGRPGEPARTLSPAEAVKAAGDDTPNSADFRYARMMIEHHEQAVVMTSLVPERASSTPVKRLAERIAAGQRPEIGAMEGWLTNNGGDGRAPEPHDHSAMVGMATEAQLKELRASRGKEFDQLFLTLMITHHQGAITMATEALSNGNNVLIEEMADDVIAQQTVEIGRMRTLLA